MTTKNLILDLVQNILEQDLTTLLARNFYLENIEAKDLELTKTEYAQLHSKLTLAFISVLDQEAETVINKFYDKKLGIHEER